MDKSKPQELKPRDDGVELENQFIIRLPEEPAKLLHEALQTGNLKDRMTIKLDSDLRYGEVRFDHWLLHAKLVDLPTIIECLKTIDNKSFYKTSDICQLLICKEEPDEEEKESPNKGKKKDPNKVDKKFLHPHGITPPCKNVRKRRFRKTLKKKNIEAPEIEKEVKRLFRIDNDAVKVEYEIINEDIDKPSMDQNSKEYNDGEDYNDESMNGNGKDRNDSSSQQDINVESDGDDDDGGNRPPPLSGVGEHDIFGEEVSSSDDDERQDTRLGDREMDDMSRLSADDTQMSTFSMGGRAGGSTVGAAGDETNLKAEPTTFNKDMFGGGNTNQEGDSMTSKFGDSNSNLASSSSFFDQKQFFDEFSYDTSSAPQMNAEDVKTKIADLRYQYRNLKAQHSQKAQEISSIQNPTLKQRMQETLDNLLSQMAEKELEIKKYENMASSSP